MPISPIPLMILTGFLGAGKTTLLNRLLNSDHGLKIAVMVNDFGAINIDAQLVVDVDEAEETINLSNGCICCTIRGDLVKAVMDLIARDDPPEYIIIETSGVSDPIDVVLTLRAINRVAIDSVLTVIDAEQLPQTRAEFPILAMNQIGTADLVVLNKADLVDEAQRASVKQMVVEIAPKARVIETVQGAVPLEIVLGAGRYDPMQVAEKTAQAVHVHESAPHHDQHDDHPHADHSLIFETWSWRSDQPVSYRALRRVVDSLPETIYRAKGIFFLADQPDQRAILQVVGKRAALSLEAGATTQSQVALIGTQGSMVPSTLQQLFDGALAINAPKTELGAIVDGALSWLRRTRRDIH